jgi:hypothetical protein
MRTRRERERERERERDFGIVTIAESRCEMRGVGILLYLGEERVSLG